MDPKQFGNLSAAIAVGSAVCLTLATVFGLWLKFFWFGLVMATAC